MKKELGKCYENVSVRRRTGAVLLQVKFAFRSSDEKICNDVLKI